MNTEKKYKINEIFYSLQGEGCLAGTPMIFVRFSNCNLKCRFESSGFDCDTEFESGTELSKEEILEKINNVSKSEKENRWILFTGGEPSLQLDSLLINYLKFNRLKLAIETNGTISLPEGIDWIAVSPKTAEHTIKQKRADEVKYIRRNGQNIPKTSVNASNKLICVPTNNDGTLDKADLLWCKNLALENPDWRLSVQYHKFINIR